MLTCNAKGEFTILVVADPQCEEFYQWKEAGEELETLVKRAAPDFVLVDGDMETDNKIPAEGWADFIRPLTQRGIPWSTVNGNHDPFCREIEQIYESFPGCRNETVDAEDVFYEPERPLNYVLPIYANDGESLVFAVYAMDSGGWGRFGWEGFTEKQIKWYRRNSDALRAENGGEAVPALLCCHIPFAETERMTVLDGVCNETPTFTAEENNKGFLDAACEQGDVKIAVFGHSHQINRIGLYRGMLLGYAGKVSTGSYHDSLARGGRVIRIRQEAPEKFTTCWLAAISESADQPETGLSAAKKE